jgi:hypothetical protein
MIGFSCLRSGVFLFLQGPAGTLLRSHTPKNKALSSLIPQRQKGRGPASGLSGHC